MADHYALNYSELVKVPPQKAHGGDYGGIAHNRYDEYTTDGTEAAADKIYVGQLMPGERVVGGDIVFGAMGSGRTLTLGDADDADRFLAATSVANAGAAQILAAAGFGYRNTGVEPIALFLTVAGGTLAADKAIKLNLRIARW